ncbi:MAG: adenylate/guanylate cyclase domain-containing protein [Dehalococcoidia bacterium]|nr:adenylate/guanylate cyclase domain-containing protein [Dehalococcoidia bacterium]
MEPRIQYAKTTDGVSIAFWTLGEGGTPLVMTSPLSFSNISLEWRIPELRAWYERLAGGGMVVRFDWRNMGMSERGVVVRADIEQRASDFESVVEELGLETFNLLAFGGPGLLTFPYLAHHPDHVSRLVLWSTLIRGWVDSPALLSLAQTDWDLVVETFAHTQIGWGVGGEAHEWAEFIRASITQSDFVRLFEVVLEMDASPYLERVGAKTLVLYQPPRTLFEVNARELATRIPDAEIVRLNEGPFASYLHEEGKRVTEEFLGIAPETAQAAETILAQGMLAVLFADIADSTALTERLGDAAFRAKARDLDGALRAAIRENAGTPIEGKLLGDGVLAVFTSARQAIEAALACGRAGDEAGLPLHLGLHAGDVIREENNVYGGAVNIASRISGLSAPGEVLVSETVRSLARTSAGVRFEDRGEQSLKGIGELVRMWMVREGEAP